MLFFIFIVLNVKYLCLLFMVVCPATKSAWHRVGTFLGIQWKIKQKLKIFIIIQNALFTTFVKSIGQRTKKQSNFRNPPMSVLRNKTF